MGNTRPSYDRLHPAASYYGSIGWKILPCYGIGEDGRCTCGMAHNEPKDIGKHPALSEWQNKATEDQNHIGLWWEQEPRYNAAVNCAPSGFFVLDIDPRSGGIDSFDELDAGLFGIIPATVEAITGEYIANGKVTRGRHLYFKVDPNETLTNTLKPKGFPGIDVKHNGYVLLAPSNHVSGVQYEWKPGHAPWEMEMAEAPEELLVMVRKGRKRAPAGSSGSGGWDWVGDLEWNGEKLDVDKFFNEGITEGSRAIDMYAMGCALANKFGTDIAGRNAVISTMKDFNRMMVKPPMHESDLMPHIERAIKFVEEHPKIEVMGGGIGAEAAAWARGRSPVVTPKAVEFSTSDPDDIDSVHYTPTNFAGTAGGAVEAAANNGFGLRDAANLLNMDVPLDTDALTDEEGGKPGMRSLTDTGNGRRLVDTFGPVIRYSAGLGFFHWNGGYWKPDTENLEVRELAKRMAPLIASEVVNYEDNNKKQEVVKWAAQAKSNARLGGTVESATSDPRILVDVEEWDSNVYQLGVANGVIDLQTGDLLKGRPDLFITRRSPVKYQAGRRDPRWESFIDYATGGDKEYQDWLQRAAGYTLTGLRTHDVAFLVYGPGGTGKNVLVESFIKCMGTQQYGFPMDSMILAQGDGQARSSDQYHWAELRGRRMVWVDELPESEKLKENSVKKLTGSNEISARSPGEKPFTFSSRAKLWITTNHRPIINDDAMWRRLRPIPWLNVPTIPDPGLKDYLFDPEGGLPAVLAWMVEGAVKYLNSTERDKLGWCKVVSDAAEVYRKNEDRIGMFLEDETNEVPGASLPVRALYHVYRGWSDGRGERPMTQIAFQRKISDRGGTVIGQGARAEIRDRSLAPQAPPSGETNWSVVNQWNL